jgi:hypothetical protein
MEDVSLPDLFELSKELFEHVKIPEGSVFLFGSVSYLSRVGTSVYESNWLSVISQTEGHWHGVRVCPLIPMILSTCPETLARELSELAAWLAIVYGNNPLGMWMLWAAAVAVAEDLFAGRVALPTMDMFKIPLPATLALTTQFTSMTFCSVSSHPATLEGLPKSTLSELYLVGEISAAETGSSEQNVILLGAAILDASRAVFEV